MIADRKLKMMQKEKGFTLIELLIVITIIGILAGVITVVSNNVRNKALIAAATQVAKSLTPYASDCILNGNEVLEPSEGNDWEVCEDLNGTKYPSAPEGCSWSNGSIAGQTFAITCGTTVIECDAETASCKTND